MTFILSKKSKVYKRLPFWQKEEVNRGRIQGMHINDYKEALEEVWGKNSALVETQIERIKYLQEKFIAGKDTVLFSVCEHY